MPACVTCDSKKGTHFLQCKRPLLALSGESQGGEFTSAFGGVAEVHRRTASAAFDANDPNRTMWALICCATQLLC
jgi:hypothetical protein